MLINDYFYYCNIKRDSVNFTYTTASRAADAEPDYKYLTEQKEMEKESLDQIWDSIGYDSVDFLDREFESIAPKLLEFLIVSILDEEEVDIGIFSEGKQKGSTITYDFFVSDKNLSLRLLPSHNFELELMMYDSTGEERLYKKTLKSDEAVIIPERLKWMMKEVLKERVSRAFNISSLLN